MGFIHPDHGLSRIAVEQRSESFYIHPAYGYEITCPTCEGEPLQGGTCRECGGRGEIPHPFASKYWRQYGHPEFLLDDVPDLIKALADLPTCPPEVKEALTKGE